MKRRWEIDALRGLMLVLMNLTHLPTRFAEPAGQPFGYVSAAEGFVLLSAFTAGLVYSERARREGVPAMRRAFLLRVLKLYACQAALLLFLFTVIAVLGVKIDQPDVKNLMSFYLQHPRTGLWSGLLLIYNPPLLDILPIYIVFMLVSPWLIAYGSRHGWRGILLTSALLWLLAQFDLSGLLYAGLVALTGLPVPFRETGSFEMFAWQFLWVLGLWLGNTAQGPVASPVPERFPRWIVVGALAWAGICLVWRHALGQNPFPGLDALEPLFDKWHLGPLRLLDLFALMVLALQFGRQLGARVPRPRFLIALGMASLPVFCAHLVVVLLALVWVGGAATPHPLWLDVMVVAASFSVLSLVAWVARRHDSFARPEAALPASASRPPASRAPASRPSASSPSASAPAASAPAASATSVAPSASPPTASVPHTSVPNASAPAASATAASPAAAAPVPAPRRAGG